MLLAFAVITITHTYVRKSLVDSMCIILHKFFVYFNCFYCCLQEDGGKCINSNDFTFEMFMSIYSKLVNQREDVQRIVEK